MKLSLTARLVLTTVALAAVVCIAIAATVTLTMRANLMDRLDRDVQDLAESASRPGLGAGFNRSPGTLWLGITDFGASGGGVARSFTRQGYQELSAATVSRLAEVPVDTPTTISVPGFGRYRVIVVDRLQIQVESSGAFNLGRLVVGLPTEDVDDTVESLLITEVALTGGGVIVIGVAAFALVRRQLRPLRQVAATAHEVAELPLSSGEVGLTSRVPSELTDERTEVGQVGSALNTLLEHVEESLSARHRSEQQVRQFVADASHELRTPLTTIRGYTELARAHPDETTTATALTKITEESGRMTTLVEDLLLLARLDQGRPLENEPVDLSRLLVEAVDDARVVDSDHQWRIEAPAQEVVVAGDRARLHQVIANLLTNARTYTPAGTVVTVRVKPDGFVVHDNGPGFAPELLGRAFERFTRGEESRQRASAETGAGLGLSLVRAIVESHGGSVSLVSVPGDTSITVRLRPAT
ncbi:HAMP domain-containing sensor histidine kinase [soil metagenome]